MGYYCNFVNNYGKIIDPLTMILKNNGFIWNLATKHSFQDFKVTMCTTLVLDLPDLCTGVWWVKERHWVFPHIIWSTFVFHQEIIFWAPLGEIHLWKGNFVYSTCCRSLAYITLGKLLPNKLDHKILKYFLEKRISSLNQQKWVTKMFGYDYEIIYKKGK